MKPVQTRLEAHQIEFIEKNFKSLSEGIREVIKEKMKREAAHAWIEVKDATPFCFYVSRETFSLYFIHVPPPNPNLVEKNAVPAYVFSPTSVGNVDLKPETLVRQISLQEILTH